MSKDYEMKNQIRRAAISAMNNIAEGFSRISKREFVRFLEISSASANEVKSMTYVAFDLGYWSKEQAASVQQKTEIVRALDLGLIKHLVSQYNLTK